MDSPQCGRRDEDCKSRLVRLWHEGHLLIPRRFCLFVLSCSLASAVQAQTPTNLDCTDPLLSTTYECSNQPQESAQPLNQSGTQGTYNPYPAVPSPTNPLNPNGNGTSNYTDIEQYMRQAARQQQPIRPEPLTEFQKFVASTTGQVLPIYGADLFRRIPSTFAPVDMAPVPPDYVVGPGDELRIRIWGQVNRQANVRVDRSGEIYLPDVGQVHVAGLTFSELDSHLRAAVGRVYRNFDLTVDMGQIRAIQVYLSGEARRPGVYTVSSLSTLVDALFASGGPSIEGSLRSIELRRNGAVITHFDLYDLLIRGDKTKDVKLLPGDVIFIPPVGSEVAVLGSVRNPAIYELLPHESLAGILADAGGVSAVAAEARISIERIDEHHDRQAMEVTYDTSGLSTPLDDGDTIRVYSIVPMYQKTVTIRGNIANPGRFAWHPGMRISDLIPDKDSLLTRNYWWRRAQMGLPAPEFEPIPNLGNMRQPAENHPITLPQPGQPGANGFNQNGATQSQSGTGQYQGQYGYQDQYGFTNPNGQLQDQYGTDQYDYGMQYPDNSQQGQTGTGQNPNLNAQLRAGSTPLAAQEVTSTNRIPSSAQQTRVQVPAPEIDWDYAVIERLNPETLKTELLPFDLGKLVMQHDASQNLELQPGDIVSIFSEADIRVPVAEQTKLVRLEGEFVHAGVYSALPGETLRHLVERAGGFTPNAYLYGSEFTRLSTQAVQQARIDEYVQSLSLGIQRSTLALASSPTAAAQTIAGSSAAQSSQQNLISALRQIRATGRIVLAMQPNSTGVNSLPDIPLEDGDRFIVPHRPTAVNVVGSVYNQNSFLFGERLRVGSYLRLAGGANKDADRKHEFIIRANGEVVSRDTTNGLWGNEFYNQPVYAGDTIVIPEKTFKPSALYGVMNWSQMFSQFALGAASLSVLP